jgi:nitrogen fixation-related uncharacterized protein
MESTASCLDSFGGMIGCVRSSADSFLSAYAVIALVVIVVAIWWAIKWSQRDGDQIAAKKRSAAEAGSAPPPKRRVPSGPQQTDLFLIEEVEGGSWFFGLILIIYNIAMPLWFFFGTHSVMQETVIALMWIGGNQAFGFLMIQSRRRKFVVYRNPSEIESAE